MTVQDSADRLRAFGIADVFVPGLADATALGTELPVEPGTDLLLPVGVGLALVLLGAVAVTASRRRGAHA